MKLKKKKYLLLILLLVVTIGFALLSTTLKINGIAGIKSNRWSIHWDDESISETQGSVTATTPANVSDTDKKNVNFEVDLELPGDYYEFTVDAKNYGTISGKIDEVKVNYYINNSLTSSSLPEYLSFSFTHEDGTDVSSGEYLDPGESQKYKVRLEFNADEEELPSETSIRLELEINVVQPTGDKYTIMFNPNGGSVSPTSLKIIEGRNIGVLPVPEKENCEFQGWYIDLENGVEITSDYVPTNNIELFAKWSSSITENLDFETSEWTDIVDAIDNDNTGFLQDAMDNGKYRIVEFDSQDYRLRVANVTTPDECKDSNFSQSACGVVLEFVDILETHRMNPYDSSIFQNGNGNTGGWKYSEMRAYVNSSKYLEDTTEEVDFATTGIYNRLPSDLKSVIKKTKVISSHGKKQTENFETMDYLYLLSKKEIWGGTSSSIDSSYDTTRQLDYYYNLGVKATTKYAPVRKLSSPRSTTYKEWWTRSAHTDNKYYFNVATNNGGPDYFTSSNYAYGVSPAFRIG